MSAKNHDYVPAPPRPAMTDTPAESSPDEPEVGRFAAFRHGSFALYFLARVFTTFGAQVLSVAVIWHIYALTKSALYTGLVGLVQFLPLALLVLVTGTAADQFGRRMIMGLSIVLAAACAAAMAIFTGLGMISAVLMLSILVVFGVARAFLGPASSSLVVSLVPGKDFANAVTWNSSAWQAATIVGPAAGGLLLGLGERPFTNWLARAGQPQVAGFLDGHGPEIAYTTALIFMLLGALLVFAIPKPPKAPPKERPTLSNMLEGFRFIWKQKIILGAISLDLFAVLMGGVVALLPIYAEDILKLGPEGLGWLRAAPAIGAIAMAGVIAAFPIKDHAGRIMFVCVALFGIFTVVFGLSTTAWLSITALICLGAADMVSVVVRETLLQLWTPDEVRGRVNAVNSVFVSASNELGEFRAGTMAHAIGPAAIGAVPAVVIGGVGAIAVAGIWALMFPTLRNARRLDGKDVQH
ncbi:MAG TPA: MFS transporter [Hyphomonadaceae bacterium]|nr:MFS transporter [Hyphomonadaceae bacterium]